MEIWNWKKTLQHSFKQVFREPNKVVWLGDYFFKPKTLGTCSYVFLYASNWLEWPPDSSDCEIPQSKELHQGRDWYTLLRKSLQCIHSFAYWKLLNVFFRVGVCTYCNYLFTTIWMSLSWLSRDLFSNLCQYWFKRGQLRQTFVCESQAHTLLNST